MRDRSRGLIAGLFPLLAACGDSSPTGSMRTPTPTPTPAPVPTVIMERASTFPIPSSTLVDFGDFTTTESGRLEVILDWTFDANNVDVFISRELCTLATFNAGTCPMALFGISTTAKPERAELPNLPPGQYFVLVANHGPGTESISFQVILYH